jgi:6-phosphogluconate dehydrogenase
MAAAECDIALVGLGVMGRNLALNMADHGVAVVGYDADGRRVRSLCDEAAGRVRGAADLGDLVASLRSPRAVMLMVPAGAAVDTVIDELATRLSPGDLIIDGGNSHFRDTDRRAERLADCGLAFLGVGISGGAEGARRGPSIMPGGPREAYDRVRPIFEAVAAQVDGQPCVTWLGPGASGHFVKMVHNGIEYAAMQLLAETYDLMRRGFDLDNDGLHEVYTRWNRGLLEGYLVEITAAIFLRRDDQAEGRLIDAILDEAGQKGTGAWTSEAAMDLGEPVPTIDAAVAMRNLSARRQARDAAAAALGGPEPVSGDDADLFIERLRGALLAGMLTTYVQGMSLLGEASRRYGYGLQLADVARIWRGGCIIRSALLDVVSSACREDPPPASLLASAAVAEALGRHMPDLRAVVAAAAELGIGVPALMASLGYVDSLRAGRLPASLIQAQRDFFGAHTYRRVDSEGSFHTQW